MRITERWKSWLAWVEDAASDPLVDEAGYELAAFLRALVRQAERDEDNDRCECCGRGWTTDPCRCQIAEETWGTGVTHPDGGPEEQWTGRVCITHGTEVG